MLQRPSGSAVFASAPVFESHSNLHSQPFFTHTTPLYSATFTPRPVRVYSVHKVNIPQPVLEFESPAVFCGEYVPVNSVF